MIDSTEAQGSWSKQKDKLKQRFAILTDNDLFFKKGMKDEMLERIQLILGKTKEELRTIITEL